MKVKMFEKHEKLKKKKIRNSLKLMKMQIFNTFYSFQILIITGSKGREQANNQLKATKEMKIIIIGKNKYKT